MPRGGRGRKQFYGFVSGGDAGVADSWESCSEQVTGLPGARCKGFATREAAQQWAAAQGAAPPADYDPPMRPSRAAWAERAAAARQQYQPPAAASGSRRLLRQRDDDDGGAPTHRLLRRGSDRAGGGGGGGGGGGDRATLYFDGASRGNPGQAGAGALLECARGKTVWQGAEPLHSAATNNQAEYAALVLGLRQAVATRRGGELQVRGDSELVLKQMRGEYRVKHPQLKPLHGQAQGYVRQLQQQGVSVRFEHVPRGRNAQADSLANSAADRAPRW